MRWQLAYRWRWTIFWLALGVVALGGEGMALANGGAGDTATEQVWWVLGLHPAVYWGAFVAFSVGFAVLVLHFFGRRNT